ncbi:MAG TPA: NAD-dependent epimerase/dehydratase family protein [Oligoflexus sp.]|uniref:NAD-dependent epimerase/dehydratase family protein n=1 Tax=Oligoflexus sp. TaxID=1971216 RepID=UPI002D7E2269|nr:NAD-dependent epimerase/dehydratase family protein [Oligoflexus sp.]HET9238181.1 NAD-dependent epimerase/dehydratase family protein [Oligoflexus sp.]
MTEKNAESTAGLHTILGAGGAISDGLIQELTDARCPYRLVRRTASSAPNTFTADLCQAEQVMAAVAGSKVVYLLAGLPYNSKVWQEQWPRIMQNTLEACQKHKAKLIFFDNVYMYGKVDGVMTEETPCRPSSKKGEVRLKIAKMLLESAQKGQVKAMIARSADFYGPSAGNGIPNTLVFDTLLKKGKAMCLANADSLHAYTYTPDAAKALFSLAQAEDAWGQVWHLPTDPNALTGKAFIEQSAQALGLPPKFFVLKKWMCQLGSYLNPMIKEVNEMLYQNEKDYLFSSAKFEKRFGWKATPYPSGIQETARVAKLRR